MRHETNGCHLSHANRSCLSLSEPHGSPDGQWVWAEGDHGELQWPGVVGVAERQASAQCGAGVTPGAAHHRRVLQWPAPWQPLRLRLPVLYTWCLLLHQVCVCLCVCVCVCVLLCVSVFVFLLLLLVWACVCVHVHVRAHFLLLLCVCVCVWKCMMG